MLFIAARTLCVGKIHRYITCSVLTICEDHGSSQCSPLWWLRNTAVLCRLLVYLLSSCPVFHVYILVSSLTHTSLQRSLSLPRSSRESPLRGERGTHSSVSPAVRLHHLRPPPVLTHHQDTQLNLVIKSQLQWSQTRHIEDKVKQISTHSTDLRPK